MSDNNVELVQRAIDLYVAWLLITGGVHTNAIEIGRTGLQLALGGSALEREITKIVTRYQ